ncbi:hypothetical protein [Hominifimenecus sp. rT4P-3]|uniref:hypothetical protein n=1 Tax=Hominifimenecus sp. rT4P-3 TaxID=3242979 RepID=UPI003DA66EAF
MEGSQCYIGVPNGVVLCVDTVVEYQLQGRFYHSYSREATKVHNTDELIFELEQFFDEIRFPHPATNNRNFFDEKPGFVVPQERKKVMKDEELLRKHGDMGTFIIRVQHRQNSSWQGRITWADKNKTVNFRSIWEMIKLIAGALDTVSTQEGGAAESTWAEESDDFSGKEEGNDGNS